jgi:hypothetical protein
MERRTQLTPFIHPPLEGVYHVQVGEVGVYFRRGYIHSTGAQGWQELLYSYVEAPGETDRAFRGFTLWDNYWLAWADFLRTRKKVGTTPAIHRGI